MRYLLVALSIISSSAYCKDYGVHGQTFAIAEESLLDVIQRRLHKLQQSGDIKVHQKKLAETAKAKVQRPTPVAGITRARQNTRRVFDPTFTLTAGIKDHKGKVVALKGTQVNPLDYVSLTTLVFINGDDKEQVSWARDQPSRWVLINGSPIALESQEGRRVYFDQGGFLARKFNIKAVPTRITQRDKVLVIEEVALK